MRFSRPEYVMQIINKEYFIPRKSNVLNDTGYSHLDYEIVFAEISLMSICRPGNHVFVMRMVMPCEANGHKFTSVADCHLDDSVRQAEASGGHFISPFLDEAHGE